MTTNVPLPRHLADAVQDETKGQIVIWSGQSSTPKTFGLGMLIWLFAIPWTVFAVGWEAMAIGMFYGDFGLLGESGKFFRDSSKASQGTIPFLFSIIFPLWGLPFIAIGFSMLASPFVLTRQARNTATVLTDTQLMTITAMPNGKRRVAASSFATFVSIKRTEHADNSGDLDIMAGRERDGDGDLRDKHHKIVGVANVRQVERRIREAMAKTAR